MPCNGFILFFILTTSLPSACHLLLIHDSETWLMKAEHEAKSGTYLTLL